MGPTFFNELIVDHYVTTSLDISTFPSAQSDTKWSLIFILSNICISLQDQITGHEPQRHHMWQRAFVACHSPSLSPSVISLLQLSKYMYTNAHKIINNQKITPEIYCPENVSLYYAEIMIVFQ